MPVVHHPIWWNDFTFKGATTSAVGDCKRPRKKMNWYLRGVPIRTYNCEAGNALSRRAPVVPGPADERLLKYPCICSHRNGHASTLPCSGTPHCTQPRSAMENQNNSLYNPTVFMRTAIELLTESTYRRSYQASRLRTARLYKLHTWRLCEVMAIGTWAMFPCGNCINSAICCAPTTTDCESCQNLCAAKRRHSTASQHWQHSAARSIH